MTEEIVTDRRVALLTEALDELQRTVVRLDAQLKARDAAIGRLVSDVCPACEARRKGAAG